MEQAANFIPLVILFVIFYFLIIRPQQKQQKEHAEMLEALTKKDKILTSGGLYAEVVKVEEPGEILNPLVYVIPLQLLAYYTAVFKGTDVDQPRNLAKSVTVE